MLIERKEYLDKLLAWMDKQLIKVITGVRRCGKSTLMEMFQAHLKKDGVEESAVPIGIFKNIKFYRIALSNDVRNPSVQYPWDFSFSHSKVFILGQKRI